MSPDERKKVGLAISRKLEDFYDDLDALAPSDIDSRAWLKIVENEIGSGGTFEGYEEWVQETWEPLEAAA